MVGSGMVRQGMDSGAVRLDKVRLDEVLYGMVIKVVIGKQFGSSPNTTQNLCLTFLGNNNEEKRIFQA